MANLDCDLDNFDEEFYLASLDIDAYHESCVSAALEAER